MLLVVGPTISSNAFIFWTIYFRLMTIISWATVIFNAGIATRDVTDSLLKVIHVTRPKHSYHTTAASLSFLSDNSCFSLIPIRQQLLLSPSYQTTAASLSFLQHDAYDSGREFTEFELYISDHHINQGSKLSDLSIITCDVHSMDIELWSYQLF